MHQIVEMTQVLSEVTGKASFILAQPCTTRNALSFDQKLILHSFFPVLNTYTSSGQEMQHCILYSPESLISLMSRVTEALRNMLTA